MPFEKKLHPKSNNKPRTHARKHKKFIDIACAVNWLCKQTTIWWRIVVIRTDCIHILGVRVLLRNEHWSHTQYTYATCSFSILVFFSSRLLVHFTLVRSPKTKKKLWPFIYIVLLHRASALSNSFLSVSLFLVGGVCRLECHTGYGHVITP